MKPNIPWAVLDFDIGALAVVLLTLIVFLVVAIAYMLNRYGKD